MSRTCFVVSAFGRTPEEQRSSRQVLRHLIGKAIPGYTVVRADQIDDEGLITNQIIEHLIQDDLVIADLTGLNPNVFYEVAVRHAARKPIVHLITKGQDIPFDIANMRAVQYALDDPDVLEEATEDLRGKVEAIEKADFKAALNPVTAAVDVALLRGSDEPAARETGEILASLHELRAEVRQLGRRVPPLESRDPRRRNSIAHEEVYSALKARGVSSPEGVAEDLWITEPLAESVLSSLEGDRRAAKVDDGRWVALE